MSLAVIHLVPQVPVMVTTEADLDRPAPKPRSLTVSRRGWHNILALAEREGFKAFCGAELFEENGPDLFQVAVFAEALRHGLARLQTPAAAGRGTRGSSRFTPDNALREFFAEAANVKELLKVIALAQEGHRLRVVK